MDTRGDRSQAKGWRCPEGVLVRPHYDEYRRLSLALFQCVRQYTPLLVPQIAFLFGAQMLLVRANLDGTLVALVWSHLLFVFPYVFLSLSDPWRAFDLRYRTSALALTGSPLRVFVQVELPLMLRPMLFALAIGFAVSVGQYLPTVFAGGGRFTTLTVEAVTLSSGNDPRVTGIYALMQAALPLAVYLLAVTVPARRDRARGGPA